MQRSHSQTNRSSSIDAWAALDTLPDYLVVLDADATICYANQAWQMIAAKPLPLGANYLTVYQGLVTLDAADSQALRAGVEAILHGSHSRVDLEHRATVGAQQYWFATTILPFPVKNTRGALVQQRDITTWRQPQQSSQDPTYFAQDFLDLLPTPIFYKDMHGVYRGCNRAFLAYMGKRQEEIIGKTVYDVAPAALAEMYHQADLDLMRQGGVQTYESQVAYADGSIRDVVFNKAVLVNPDNTPGGVVGLMLDITTRKRTEEALRGRDAILEAMSFAAGRFLAGAAWNQDIQLVLAHLGAATGVSRVYLFENHHAPDDTLLTSQRYEWAAPGVTPQIDNPVLQDMSYQAVGLERWITVLRRGEPIFGLVNTFPADENEILASQDIRSIAVVPIFVRDAWWGFIGFDDCQHDRDWSTLEMETLRVAAKIIGTAILRVEMEQELQRSEQRYRELFENASDIIYTHDLHGYFTSVNRAAEQLTGYTREELTTMHISRIIAPDSLRHAQEMTRLKLEHGGATPYEMDLITRDGRRITVETNSRLIYQHGKPIAVQGSARDITLRKQSEEAMRQLVWQEEVIRIQEATLAQLSTPLLLIANKVVLMPLIGALDSYRAQRAMEELLQGVSDNRARVVILDISGVPVVDTQVASALIRTAQAVRMLGAQVIITGIGPDIAQTLVGMGITLGDVVTQASLQSGVAYALKRWGVTPIPFK